MIVDKRTSEMNEATDTSDTPTPTAIERVGDAAIRISWSDGSEVTWSAGQLRKDCPCATCREKRRGDQDKAEAKPLGLPVLSAAEARPLTIESMSPVGSYAYNIAFSDGHSSGIFPLETLYKKE